MISLKQYILEGILDIEDNFNSNTDILIAAAAQDYPSPTKRSSAFKKLYDMLKTDIAKKSPKTPWVEEKDWFGKTVGDLSFFKDQTFYIMFNKNDVKSSNLKKTYDKPELSIFYVNYSRGGKPNDLINCYHAFRKQKLKDEWATGTQNISYQSWGPTIKREEYPNVEIYELPDEYKELWKILVEKYIPKNLSTYKEYMSYLK